MGIGDFLVGAFRRLATPQPKVTRTLIQRVDTRLRLHEELGSGRYGVVRVGNRVEHPNERIAVKIVPKSLASTQELRNEVKCLERVRGHKNVMELLDSFEDRTHVYLLTPLYSGGELFDRIITQGTFSEADAARNMIDLLNAISHCHSQSIVHRDIKPENLLYSSVDADAHLVLVDFGMSREFVMDNKHKMDLQCGSPSYVAPEVLGRDYNEKCDAWSAGIILHILLVGRTPFGNGTDDEILTKVEHFDHAELDSLDWKDISKEAKDLVSKLLERDPRKRISPLKALDHPWMLSANLDSENARRLVLRSALENMKEFNKHRRLKRAAIRVIAELARNEEDAKRFANELATVPRADPAGKKVKLDDLVRIMPSVNVDDLKVTSTGLVDLSEVIASALAKSIYLDEQYLLAAFKRFDVSGDGLLDRNELAMALGKDPKLDRELVAEAMKDADKDGNGFISFEEFASVVRDKTVGSEAARKKREATLNIR